MMLDALMAFSAWAADGQPYTGKSTAWQTLVYCMWTEGYVVAAYTQYGFFSEQSIESIQAAPFAQSMAWLTGELRSDHRGSIPRSYGRRFKGDAKHIALLEHCINVIKIDMHKGIPRTQNRVRGIFLK